MLRQGYGQIVNVASLAAKAAVVALTKSLGKELATTGMLANCVTPGIVDTDLVRGTDPHQIDVLVDKIPMRRRGRPAEIAELVCWPASPRCSFHHRGGLRRQRRPHHPLRGRSMTRAVVLGVGGITGISWEAGVVRALQETGPTSRRPMRSSAPRPAP